MSAEPGAGPSVVVVGGGIAGLVAARDLARAGARVELLEAEAELGGRIRGAMLDGARIDVGVEAFATRGGAVRELITELGMADEIVQPRPMGSWVVAARGSVPLPAAGAVGIPASPLSRMARHALGLSGALRAACEPLLPRRIGGKAESLDDLVRTRLGPRVLERLVRPVALGVYSLEPTRLAVDAIPELREAFERRGSLIIAARELRGERTAAGGAVAGLRGGMTSLIEALAEELSDLGVPVRTGIRVRELRCASPLADASGSHVGSGSIPSPDQDSETQAVWLVRDDRGAELRADAVILAVPERTARTLLGEPGAQAPQTPGIDASFETAVEVVALALDDTRLDRAPRGTGALVAHDARPHCSTYVLLKPVSAPDAPWLFAKALTHVTAKWAERAAERPSGRHVLRLSYGRAGLPPETEQLSDDEVRSLALRDASRILGIELRPESLRAMTRRSWRNGLPPTPERTIDPPSGVVCVGDWVSGTGLASVVPGSRLAARRLLERLGARELAGSERTPSE